MVPPPFRLRHLCPRSPALRCTDHRPFIFTYRGFGVMVISPRRRRFLRLSASVVPSIPPTCLLSTLKLRPFSVRPLSPSLAFWNGAITLPSGGRFRCMNSLAYRAATLCVLLCGSDSNPHSRFYGVYCLSILIFAFPPPFRSSCFVLELGHRSFSISSTLHLAAKGLPGALLLPLLCSPLLCSHPLHAYLKPSPISAR